MKKLKYGSLFLITVLFLTSFAALITANDAQKPNLNNAESNSPKFNVPASNLPLEWCQVNLDNPRSSLNVRTSEGRIVGKVKHGTRVFVNEYEDDWARISIRQGRRLVSIGWVSNEYLIC